MELLSLTNDFYLELRRLRGMVLQQDAPSRSRDLALRLTGSAREYSHTRRRKLATKAIGFWDAPRGPLVAYAVIRLLDAWNRFCRQLVLLSARGNIVTQGGRQIERSPVVLPGQNALDALKVLINPKPSQYLWEPKWFIPNRAIKAAQLLKVQNLGSVSAGLGLSSTGIAANIDAIEDLRNCRNYYAHRSKHTFDELSTMRRRLSIPTTVRIDEYPTLLASGGATLFDAWCADLTIRATSAVQ